MEVEASVAGEGVSSVSFHTAPELPSQVVAAAAPAEEKEEEESEKPNDHSVAMEEEEQPVAANEKKEQAVVAEEEQPVAAKQEEEQLAIVAGEPEQAVVTPVEDAKPAPVVETDDEALIRLFKEKLANGKSLATAEFELYCAVLLHFVQPAPLAGEVDSAVWRKFQFIRNVVSGATTSSNAAEEEDEIIKGILEATKNGITAQAFEEMDTMLQSFLATNNKLGAKTPQRSDVPFTPAPMSRFRGAVTSTARKGSTFLFTSNRPSPIRRPAPASVIRREAPLSAMFKTAPFSTFKPAAVPHSAVRFAPPPLPPATIKKQRLVLAIKEESFAHTAPVYTFAPAPPVLGVPPLFRKDVLSSAASAHSARFVFE